ncbi:MAG: hypothetical protein H6620_07500 [Halobacteriovoraceae bacterium]|nr:hypothetical protein [Halobacteriovoraceae bacterium]
MNRNDLDKDFKNFISNSQYETPKKLRNEVIGFVRNDLNPSRTKVFMKLITIHFVVGILTMIFCPQYNLSITHNYDLFHYFHHNFGEQICMIICGSIFLGSGALIAAQILNKHEIKTISTHKLLFYIAASSFFASAFIFISTNVYLKLVPFWLMGSTLSGLLLFESSLKIRTFFLAKHDL